MSSYETQSWFSPSRRTRALATWLALCVLVARGDVVIGPWTEGDITTNVDVLVECDSAAAMTFNYGTTTNYGRCRRGGVFAFGRKGVLALPNGACRALEQERRSMETERR